MDDLGDKRYLYEKERQKKKKARVIILGVTFTLLGVGGVIYGVVYTLTDKYQAPPSSLPEKCPLPADSCIFTLVESIPDNLTFPAGSPKHPSTFSGIHQILGMATETIEIASYYWTLRSTDISTTDNSTWAGDQLFQDLLTAGKDRGIKIRIVQSWSKTPVNDTLYLQAHAGAEVRSIDFTRLVGAGILHTKLWIIDRKHFYIGSANLDWRSFTQVKEMGAVVKQCGCLAHDLGKIFDAYWYLATPVSTIPSTWPDTYNTLYNSVFPMKVNFNGTKFDTFFSSSPPPVCPSGRAGDGDTIVQIINSADEYVQIAVMDYFPTTQFRRPREYWPNIDDALRKAAFDRKVTVKLLVSYWDHTWDEMFAYLWSLQDLKYHSKYLHVDIQVKLFVVPAYTDAQKNIPYSRVNHNKYMVTDKTAYIGTSNWSGDYFLVTGGIGLITSKTAGQGNGTVDIRQQLKDVFDRDWSSPHAYYLNHFNRTTHSQQ